MSVTNLKTLVQDTALLKNLQTRIAEKVRAHDTGGSYETLKLHGWNGSTLKWEEVYCKLFSIQNSNGHCSPLDVYKILEIADIISSNCVDTLAELDISAQHGQQIMLFMPVFFMQNQNDGVFINIHEFVHCIAIPSLPSTYSPLSI